MRRPFVVFGLAVGLGLAAGLLVRAGKPRHAPSGEPSRLGAPEDRTDGAVEATFPASDPPAAMASLVSGAPGRASFGWREPSL